MNQWVVTETARFAARDHALVLALGFGPLRKALIEERWSLVDQFDSDGRHFLIARRNPMPSPTVRDLSQSERRVTALAALGRANKLIAYELGISTGTVATLLSRAVRKLGVSSRSALIAHWHATQRSGA